MKIDRAVLLASIALAISLISLGLQFLPQNIATPLTGSETHMWREIASYSGTSNTITATFYVPSYLWKVSWNAIWKDLTKDAELKANLYSPGTVETEKNAFNAFLGVYRDNAYFDIHEGSETFSGSGNEFFYFKVEGRNVQTWTIRVEAWS